MCCSSFDRARAKKTDASTGDARCFAAIFGRPIVRQGCHLLLDAAAQNHSQTRCVHKVSEACVSTVHMLFSGQLSGRPNLPRCAQSLLSFAICGQSVDLWYSCRPAVLSPLWSHGLWSCQHLPPRTERSLDSLVHLNDMQDNVCATVARRCCGF